MRISILIPTYNEAENIITVLKEMKCVLSADTQHEWLVTVVDANSPDGTAQAVEEFQKNWEAVHLIKESAKRGIARAYLTGIHYAKHVLDADAFIEFDGDGQHDPRFLLSLANKLEEGADCVVGSRYLPGGSVPSEWELYRRVLSYCGSLYARILLELPVRDATSGLKATSLRSPIVQYLPLAEQELLSFNYAYKLQFLYAIANNGGEIVEIPINFRIRDFDISKSTWHDITESLKVTGLLRLRSLSSWRLLRVVLIGGIGLLIQTVFFEIVGVWLKLLQPSTAVLVGAEFAILSNFFLNQKFAFADSNSTSNKWKLLKFHLVSLTSVLFQWFFVFTAEQVFPHSALFIQLFYLIGVVAGLFSNYIGYYFWVWQR